MCKMRRRSANNFTRAKLSPTAVDLFSGCGGLTTGLKWAGFTLLAAVDIDETSVDTYRANHPEVQVWHRDIKGLSAAALRRALGLRRGGLDLLAGCPPCQAFSRLRTLNGKKVIHSQDKDLLFQFLRFVKALRPKMVMVENVPGLARDKRIITLCSKLARLGYQSEFRVLDAAHYGVPQRRRRMILLAGRVPRLKFAPRGRKLLTVRDVIAELPKPGKSGDPLHDFPENRSTAMADRIRSIPHNGGSRADLPRRLRLLCHRTCDGFKDVYGRMSWDDVAPTITTGCFNPSKGRFLHPIRNRAITMREAALLQGFRRQYEFRAKAGKCAVATMIGNALPPPFIAAHGRSVSYTLGKWFYKGNSSICR
jgi:DNA (cytosine-5)-methyltransferase 1